MKNTLLIGAAAGALTLAGAGVASAQTYVVEDAYAPPVYYEEIAPAPAVVTAAPIYAAPAPIYDTTVVPPEVVVEPAWAAPGIVYATW